MYGREKKNECIRTTKRFLFSDAFEGMKTVETWATN